MRAQRVHILLTLLLHTAFAAGIGAQPGSARIERGLTTLRTAGIPADTEAQLLDFLTSLTPTPLIGARIDAAIANLDALRFETRERASQQLVELGELARGALEQAAGNGGRSAETRYRARRLLERISDESHELAIEAALVVLTVRGTRRAVQPVLQATPQLTRQYQREAASAVLAQLTTNDDQQLLLSLIHI